MFGIMTRWLLSFFTAEKIGCLFRRLIFHTGTTIAKEILNSRNQRKAFEFVRNLHFRNDLTNEQKAKEFNRQMLEWAKKAGIILKDSVINCLRELAVNALKTQILENGNFSVQGAEVMEDD